MHLFIKCHLFCRFLPTAKSPFSRRKWEKRRMTSSLFGCLCFRAVLNSQAVVFPKPTFNPLYFWINYRGATEVGRKQLFFELFNFNSFNGWFQVFYTQGADTDPEPSSEFGFLFTAAREINRECVLFSVYYSYFWGWGFVVAFILILTDVSWEL